MSEPKKGTGKLSEIRQNPGESNAYKYEHVKEKNFAGPDHTFPINSLPRARNALSRAHFAQNPESIREKVYAKYPELKKRHEERKNDKRYQAYKSK